MENKSNGRLDADIPEGFDTRVGRELGVGWIIKAKDVVVQGRLVGRFTGTQKDDDGTYQSFYQVRLSLPVKVKTKNEAKENIEVLAEAGSVINIGEHKSLEDLGPYTRDGGVYDVWFKYLSEQKVPNTTRTFWAIKGPVLKTISAPKYAPRPEVVTKVAPQGDIPF